MLNEPSYTFCEAIKYSETPSYCIRNSFSLLKISHSLHINYFKSKFSRLRNNLPQSVRKIKSLPSFVRCIDAYNSENALNVPVSISHCTNESTGILTV